MAQTAQVVSILGQEPLADFVEGKVRAFIAFSGVDLPAWLTSLVSSLNLWRAGDEQSMIGREHMSRQAAQPNGPRAGWLRLNGEGKALAQHAPRPATPLHTTKFRPQPCPTLPYRPCCAAAAGGVLLGAAVPGAAPGRPARRMGHPGGGVGAAGSGGGWAAARHQVRVQVRE